MASVLAKARARDCWLACVVGVVWVAFVAGAYLRDLGRGFLRDDFAWISAARESLARPATILHPQTVGFYRPIVTLSFAADYVRHGLNARAYGFTNLLLYTACALLVALLFRQLRLSTAAASVGALVWALNPHGINMALLWISGRTSLLLTLFSLLAALAFMRRHRIAGAVCLGCALLSKEEAALLPLILGIWLVSLRPIPSRTFFVDIALMFGILCAYFFARQQTPAFTFSTAPWYYQPTRDVWLLLRNALEYLDRGATAAALITLIAAAIYRRAVVLDSPTRRLLVAATTWFVLGYGLTIWIPVRSSLYAVFPSVGAAFACGVLIDRLRAPLPALRRDFAFAAVLISSLLLIPVYWIRDHVWVEPARVSNRVMKMLAADADTLPNQGTILFEDGGDVGTAGFASALGGLATQGVRLFTGRGIEAHIKEVPAEAANFSHVVARYRIDRGRVTRVQ